MAVAGWLLDKSAHSRIFDPVIGPQLDELAPFHLCPVGRLERLYSAQSANDYDETVVQLGSEFTFVDAPADILDRALVLQRDLAHHHGLWHRIPIPDLLIAETALHDGLGVVHVDSDFDRIAEVRPLESRRLG